MVFSFPLTGCSSKSASTRKGCRVTQSLSHWLVSFRNHIPVLHAVQYLKTVISCILCNFPGAYIQKVLQAECVPSPPMPK